MVSLFYYFFFGLVQVFQCLPLFDTFRTRVEGRLVVDTGRGRERSLGRLRRIAVESLYGSDG